MQIKINIKNSYELEQLIKNVAKKLTNYKKQFNSLMILKLNSQRHMMKKIRKDGACILDTKKSD